MHMVKGLHMAMSHLLSPSASNLSTKDSTSLPFLPSFMALLEERLQQSEGGRQRGEGREEEAEIQQIAVTVVL